MYCILCTVYCVLYTIYCVMYNVYYILCSVYCELYTVYCKLCTVYCILYTVYCILCTVSCVLYTLNWILCTVFNVLCIVHCVLCTSITSEKNLENTKMKQDSNFSHLYIILKWSTLSISSEKFHESFIWQKERKRVWILDLSIQLVVTTWNNHMCMVFMGGRKWQ